MTGAQRHTAQSLASGYRNPSCYYNGGALVMVMRDRHPNEPAVFVIAPNGTYVQTLGRDNAQRWVSIVDSGALPLCDIDAENVT